MRKKIEKILKDFVSNFASLEDDGSYWGHDTDLGNCEKEFDLAVNQLLILFKEEEIKNKR